MTVDELLKDTVFIFGAGATSEAGCLTSAQMLDSLKSSIENIEEANQRDQFSTIFRFLTATLEYQNSFKNFVPSDVQYKANIEDLVLLLRKIIYRDYYIPAPLVGNWSDKITKLEFIDINVFENFLNFITAQLNNNWLKNNKEPDTNNLLNPLMELLKGIEESTIEIFTLNYDLVFEHYFNKKGVTNLNTGFINGKWANDFNDSKKNDKEAFINYYKIHGSLDWGKSESGEILCDKEHKPISDPLIIFGQENKMLSIDPFLSLVFNFKEKLKVAKYYVIIGYSFFDTYINNLILQSVNEEPDRKIIVIDYSFKELVEPQKFASKFISKIKGIQDNQFTLDLFNVKAIDEEKVFLIGSSSSEFFNEYFSNKAEKFISLLMGFKEKEKEDIPF